MRYLESLAVATVFIHAGQDLIRGEPAALGIPAWAFAAGFLVYAALLAPVNEYTNHVRVSGRTETETVIAKADTGAKRTSIDATVAGQLGLGPITGTTTVRSGTTGRSKTRPLVELECRVGGRWQSTTASIADRSSMQYPMILGRDVLEDYRLDIQQRVGEE